MGQENKVLHENTSLVKNLLRPIITDLEDLVSSKQEVIDAMYRNIQGKEKEMEEQGKALVNALKEIKILEGQGGKQEGLQDLTTDEEMQSYVHKEAPLIAKLELAYQRIEQLEKILIQNLVQKHILNELQGR